MLARRFASSSSPSPSFPYIQLHNSDPGQSAFKSVSAFTTPLASLPFPPLRSIAWLPTVLVVGSTPAVCWIMNRTSGTDVAEIVDAGEKGRGQAVVFGRMRRWVRIGLPVGVEEGTGMPITRLYVYSVKDEQVSFRAVESQQVNAKAVGTLVELASLQTAFTTIRQTNRRIKAIELMKIASCSA